MALGIAHGFRLGLGVVITQVVMREVCRFMLLDVQWCTYLCTRLSNNKLLKIPSWPDGEISDEHLDMFEKPSR